MVRGEVRDGTYRPLAPILPGLVENSCMRFRQACECVKREC